jgi:hypothetical protein
VCIQSKRKLYSIIIENANFGNDVTLNGIQLGVLMGLRAASP